MGFLKGGGFDWNGNGKRDAFDRFMEMKAGGLLDDDRKPNHTAAEKSAHTVAEEKRPKGISMFGKPWYDAEKDSDGIMILKCLLVVVFCLGSIALPVVAEMDSIGTLLCIFGGLGLGVLVLKNT